MLRVQSAWLSQHYANSVYPTLQIGQNCYLYLSKASIQQDFMGQVHLVPTFILVLTAMQTIFNWMAF